jgi:hypothetical protein
LAVEVAMVDLLVPVAVAVALGYLDQVVIMALLVLTMALARARTAHPFRAAARAVVAHQRLLPFLVVQHHSAQAVAVRVAGKPASRHTTTVQRAGHLATYQAAPQAPQAARSTALLEPIPCARHPAPVAAVVLLTALRPRRATAATAARPVAGVVVEVLASTL